MALQVWLPLDGNLKNYGLSNYVFTANESDPTFTAGKIGNCYQRINGSTQSNRGININDNLVSMLGTQASIAVWVKPLGTHTHYNGTIISSGNWNGTRWAFGVDQNNAQVDVFCRGHNTYITCAVPVNQWTHLVSIFDNGTCKVYKNGVYVGQLTGQAAFASDASNTQITRETYAGGYFGFNGCINDLRIYNHVLSEKEIKKIYQSLILHHTLNYKNPNRISRSQYFGGGHNGAVSTLLGPYKCTIKMPSVTNSNCRISGMGFNGSTGPFAVSLDVMSNANGTVTFDICDHSNFSYSLTANQWKHVEFTDTVSSYNTSSNYNGFLDASCTNTVANQIFTFKNYKLEDGSTVTEFCDNTYNPNISYDISGYNHNGSILNGPLTPIASSPRYKLAMKFTAKNKKIKITGLSTSQITNSYTISWWSKQNTFDATMAWGFGDGIRLNGIYGGNLWNTGDSSSNPIYSPGTTTQVSAPTTNVWHHFVMIGDGSTGKIYKDGVLWGQAKTYKGLSGTTIYINGWDTATTYSMSDLTMSDFRIYATALSASDVLELYNTSMIVNSDGTISPRVLTS